MHTHISNTVLKIKTEKPYTNTKSDLSNVVAFFVLHKLVLVPLFKIQIAFV